MTKETPKGFDCSTCGKHHVFGAYVAAHANIELTHTCDDCGAEHAVRNYRVRLIKAGGKTRKMRNAKV